MKKPNDMSDFKITPEQFWSCVDVKGKDECWTWRKTRTGKGYGFVMTSRSGGVKRRYYLSHRVAWMLKNGRAPLTTMAICHRCDNPPCCNPEHLFEGTDLDNMKDMINKGRGTTGRKLPNGSLVKGIKHPLAKMNDQKVREMREKRKQGTPYHKLAEEFGVHASKACSICLGKSWAHVV